jgi:ATP-dependent DNA helicase HFM1/MER3
MCYSTNQSYLEYTTTQINQMIGRAGRPQFDDSAKAVIMTKQSDKRKYESLLNENNQIESNLHHELIEHLNVEIVLQTIVNIRSAVNWIKSTFLYIRILKNPDYYGIKLNEPTPTDLHEKIDEYLNELCIRNLKELIWVNLVEECDFSDEFAPLRSTSNGVLMARYCLAFETMKLMVETLNPLDLNETTLSEPVVSIGRLVS